ncbi:CPBP family intramembrane glutamic endopeptidase [Nocardiopsis potens]|uniref:CPBP family intramembrane glutamic endopeptidase n=1 Tax=Nocardiopsis potens TaxID=1246458 RepID=UPI00034D84DC|nr:CPBP family intramembrane glutamic endopeptidase [Nocardiopsis potens]
MPAPAAPLLDTRVRFRDAAALAGLTLASGAVVLGAGLLSATTFARDWPAPERLALAVGPLAVLTPCLAPALGAALLMRRGPRLGLRDLGLTRPNRFPVGLLLWVPLAVLSAMLSTGAALGLAALLRSGGLLGGEGGGSGGGSSSSASGLVADLPLGPALAIALGTVLLFPLLEEVLFRGMLHGALSRSLAPWAAAVVSALVFSAAHVTPLLMPYTLVLGLWLAWLHRRYESILPGLVLHCCNNALVAAIALAGL